MDRAVIGWNGEIADGLFYLSGQSFNPLSGPHTHTYLHGRGSHRLEWRDSGWFVVFEWPELQPFVRATYSYIPSWKGQSYAEIVIAIINFGRQ